MCGNMRIIAFFLVALMIKGGQSSRLAVGDLDEEKRVILKEFSSMVKSNLSHNYMGDERYLLRFLDQTSFNQEEGRELFDEEMKWRETEKVDGILDQDWSDMEASFPYELNIVNKEGRPVLFYNYGEWDIRRVIDNGGYDRLLRYISVKIMEEAERKTRALRSGDEPLQFDILVNLDGYSLEKHGCFTCMQLYKAASDQSRVHYGRSVDKTFFVNTPYVFEQAFNFIAGSSVMDWNGRSLFLLGGKDSYGPVLEGVIDTNQLPNSLQ